MWAYEDPIPASEVIKGYVAFYWNRVDRWFEEDEEVFVHPRDPYKRVDVLSSSRRVEVIVGGETVADTTRPRLLFETGLPTRYYIPPEDVRMDRLAGTGTQTRCPYKGVARYWSVRVGEEVFEDVVWSYPEPIAECPAIRGLLCFFNERVEAIRVDGEAEPKPETRWSR